MASGDEARVQEGGRRERKRRERGPTTCPDERGDAEQAEEAGAELRKQLADLKSNEEKGAAGGTRASTSGRLPNRPEVKVDSVSTRGFLYPQSDVWLGVSCSLTTYPFIVVPPRKTPIRL